MNSPAATPPPSKPPAELAAEAKPSAPPAKSPPPAAAAAKGGGKKKSWWKFKLTLVLLVLLAVCGAAVYYFPQQVEKLSGVKIPQFVPSAKKTAEQARAPAKAAETAEEKAASERPAVAAAEKLPAPAVAVEQPVVEVVTQPAAAVVDGDALSQSEALSVRVRQLRQAVVNAQQDISDLQQRLRASELQSSDLAVRLAAVRQHEGAELGLQVQVIALQLRLSGETAAAAAALNALAAGLEDTVAARTLLDEAVRLEGVPARATLLRVLEEVLSPAVETAGPAAGEGGVGEVVKALFKVQHTPAGGLGHRARAQLAQLHLHLLTQREEAYWQLLHTMRAAGQHNAVVAEVLERLLAHGKPDYQLRWQE